MNISEDTLTTWAQGPSDTEAEKCENAETGIRKAIANDPTLGGMKVSVFAQGSYRARTNIRLDSDVDICVRCDEDVFLAEYPEGKRHEDFGNRPSERPYADFKGAVRTALVNRFGAASVGGGDKAFDVHANTYRVEADVLPAYEYRWYPGTKYDNGDWIVYKGVAFIPNDVWMVYNFPEQSYQNGLTRNEQTRRRYKRIIRILKRMRGSMKEAGIDAANNVASFLIEGLVYNAPVDAFNADNYTANLRYVLAETWNKTRWDADCAKWTEVNGIKFLFHAKQKWTRKQANDFLQAAWDYAGYTA